MPCIICACKSCGACQRQQGCADAANPCRSDLAAATRQRLEEAARKKEEEAREKAAQRYTRTEYKCGGRPLAGPRKMPPCCLCACSRLSRLKQCWPGSAGVNAGHHGWGVACELSAIIFTNQRVALSKHGMLTK